MRTSQTPPRSSTTYTGLSSSPYQLQQSSINHQFQQPYKSPIARGTKIIRRSTTPIQYSRISQSSVSRNSSNFRSVTPERKALSSNILNKKLFQKQQLTQPISQPSNGSSLINSHLRNNDEMELFNNANLRQTAVFSPIRQDEREVPYTLLKSSSNQPSIYPSSMKKSESPIVFKPILYNNQPISDHEITKFQARP